MSESILPGSVSLSSSVNENSGQIFCQINTTSISFNQNIKSADIISGIALVDLQYPLYGDNPVSYKPCVDLFPSTQSLVSSTYPVYTQMTPGHTYTLWGLEERSFATNSQSNAMEPRGTITCNTNSISISGVSNIRCIVYYIIFQ